MKSRIVRLVRLGADVAVDLVAARMPHRLALGQLARVLALADRRMIARHLLDPAGAQLVQPRIADVTDDDVAVGDDGDGQHAGHALAIRRGARPAGGFRCWRA